MNFKYSNETGGRATEMVTEPEEIDTRKFEELKMNLLDGRKIRLKLFDELAEFRSKEKPRENNILGKSIEQLKLEISNEAIDTLVGICLLFLLIQSYTRLYI